jgi:DNA-binding NarL/FixJ family response regulator
MISVLVVDDHGVMRDALQYLLESQDDMQVIASAKDGQDAVEQAKVNCPDIIVMDISMPRMDGFEATRQIHEHCPETRIVMLTINNSEEHIRKAIKSGASGYVLKEAAGKELVAAIRIIYRGEQYISSKTSNL